eukprot:XP_024443218.1 uncharacterized protein LOC18094291 [Populus trichocarpa]
MELLASYNEQVGALVLGNAPQNAKYTSHQIQKEILHVFAINVKSSIRHEIGDARFCLIVDEARDESRDESRREQMTLVIRGQGYNGASNMRGEWNRLQALFINDSPYAYYVHCLAHQLQLALIAAAREISDVHTFFQNLIFIINIVSASCKRNDELRAFQTATIEHLVDIGEIETGKGVNQVGGLQRPGDSRWSSHFKSICSLIKMYGATCLVLENIALDGSTYSQRGDVAFSFKLLMSFDFAFILHIMKDVMGITDMFCQALQQKSQDILNVMHLVTTTKTLIKKLIDDGWKTLLEEVTSFYKHQDIEVLDMDACFSSVGRSRRKQKSVIVEHHYRVDIFTAIIDQQLQELNNKFNEAIELLKLSTTLDPRNSYKLFNVKDICLLVDKFYPQDFSDQEKIHFRLQLQHYELDVPNHPKLKSMSLIADLCQGLVEIEKSTIYPLVDRLIWLLLTLPVSTATTERAFSAMKITYPESCEIPGGVPYKLLFEDPIQEDEALGAVDENGASNMPESKVSVPTEL